MLNRYLFGALLVVLTIQQTYPNIENDVLYWLNQVRANPSILISHIQNQLGRFNGYMIPITPNFNYATKQGPTAWIEAIQFLRNQKPMGTLQRHLGLDRAAFDHAADLRQYNTIRHQGTDGSKPRHRVQKHCVYEFGQISENIAQQFTHPSRNHGLQTIVSLIVDDGVKDRGHRFSLFTTKYQYAGVSTQKTNDHYITVIELSSHNLALKENNFRHSAASVHSNFHNINTNTYNDNRALNLQSNIIPQSFVQSFDSMFNRRVQALIPQSKPFFDAQSSRPSYSIPVPSEISRTKWRYG